MKVKTLVALGLLTVVALLPTTALGNGGGGTGSVQVTFTQSNAAGECEAYFNRTGSDLIHEWRQDCAPVAGQQDLHIVFRPLVGKPNPACAASEDGWPLLYHFSPWALTYSGGAAPYSDGGTTYTDTGGDEGQLADVFNQSGKQYNVCFYALPTVTISNNPVVAEGGQLVYQLSLSFPVLSPVTVQVRTSEAYSYATAGSDYVAKAETVVFAPGETQKPFAVDTLDDNRFDLMTGFNGEYVWAEITAVTNAAVPAFVSNSSTADGWGLGVILDNEAQPVLTLANNPQTTEGQSLEYQVVLSGPTDYAVAVTLDTSEPHNDATDYTPKTETITFAAGETAKVVSVATTQDLLVEGPNNLGPGDIVWIHAESIVTTPASAAILSTDFTGNLATNDLWAIGFIVDNDF